jgi:phosphoenolpyruvate carboxykinase (ATP)
MTYKNILTLHSSANVDMKTDQTTIFFGLSGTGKTTLSADPTRKLVGDDEHCWTDSGIFNIEGGCYAKCIGLNAEKEPDIFNAIKFGSLLENVVVDEDRNVNYNDISITANTRASYPITYINNALIPCISQHPNNIIFLTFDAFGVLPLVSKLNDKQAMYHFISGYTAKIAGTEVGISEPEATFSACFGEPFLMCHPFKYANMLLERINNHNVNVWLINTGWILGKYGSDSSRRCPLKLTRRIANDIQSGVMAKAMSNTSYVSKLPYFNMEYLSGYYEEEYHTYLDPQKGWQNHDEYLQHLKQLANLFVTNFNKYIVDVDGVLMKMEEYEYIQKGGPSVDLSKPLSEYGNTLKVIKKKCKSIKLINMLG